MAITAEDCETFIGFVFQKLGIVPKDGDVKNDKKWSLVSESIIYASGLETDEADGDYASR